MKLAAAAQPAIPPPVLFKRSYSQYRSPWESEDDRRSYSEESYYDDRYDEDDDYRYGRRDSYDEDRYRRNRYDDDDYY